MVRGARVQNRIGPLSRSERDDGPTLQLRVAHRTIFPGGANLVPGAGCERRGVRLAVAPVTRPG
jgi:hypothetical protein